MEKEKLLMEKVKLQVSKLGKEFLLLSLELVLELLLVSIRQIKVILSVKILVLLVSREKTC